MLRWILVYLGVGPRKLYRQPHLLSAHALVLKMRDTAAGRITPYAQLSVSTECVCAAVWSSMHSKGSVPDQSVTCSANALGLRIVRQIA